MKKKVFLIRHGQSEANASIDLDNPTKYYDTILTPLGKEQALITKTKLKKINFDLMICSPLTRTLQTFSLIFPIPISNTIILPLVRENLEHSCDVGRNPEELKIDFPNFDFSTLQKFWWNNNQVIDEKEINHESINELNLRVHQFKEWIRLREENTIAVVSHGTFISKIINFFLYNCEFEIWHPTDD